MSYDHALGTSDSWSQIIYIDGIKRRCTGLHPVTYVDSDEMPCRRCSAHSFTAGALWWLKQGNMIYTSGHRYSLHPDPETA